MVLLFKEREYIEGKLSLRVERRIGVWIGIYYVCYNYYIIGCWYWIMRYLGERYKFSCYKNEGGF